MTAKSATEGRNAPMTPTLNHVPGCPAQRIERTEHAAEHLSVTACLDCGARVVLDADGDAVPEPTVSGALSGGRDRRRTADDDLMRKAR